MSWMTNDYNFSLWGLVFFLLCIVIGQFSSNIELHKQLNERPYKVVYTPLRVIEEEDDSIDDIVITESTPLPEDFYDEVTSTPAPATAVCTSSTPDAGITYEAKKTCTKRLPDM